jgi:hypothetical protein
LAWPGAWPAAGLRRCRRHAALPTPSMPVASNRRVPGSGA